MKIIKVNTGKFYKKKYVYINNSVLDVETAVESFPRKKWKVIKTAFNYKPAKEVIQTDYSAFPSSNKMVETLLEKREQIYNKLNLKKIIGKDADVVKAIVLFDFLSTNAFYDMTSMEEVEALENSTRILSKKLDYSLEEYIKLKNELKNAKTPEEKQQIRKELFIVAKGQAELNAEYVEKEIKQQNRAYLKNLYNALMRHKGVCSEFSYLYQFLLAGQNINSFYVSMHKNKDTYGHAVNLVEYKKDDERGYYFADVTGGIATALKYPKESTHLNFFAVPKNNYLEGKMGYIITELQRASQIKKGAKDEFCNIIDMKEHLNLVQAKILESNKFKEEIKKAWQFIASEYNAYEEDEVKQL
jgi:hypothetical protein